MKQILIRLSLTLPVVWLVVSLVFLLIHLVPGDPILQMLGEGATPADIGALRHQYGLDLPLWKQYVLYWNGVVHGNLGNSIRLHDTVGHLIAARYPYTLALTVAALTLGLALALPAGILAAMRRGRWLDQTLSVVSLFGLSVPGLVLGPLLILVFAIFLGWLPVSGANSGGTRGIDWPYLVLPSVAMGASLAAILTRMVRTAMLEELGQDYIRTARAKGLTETAVVCRHFRKSQAQPKPGLKLPMKMPEQARKIPTVAVSLLASFCRPVQSPISPGSQAGLGDCNQLALRFPATFPGLNERTHRMRDFTPGAL